MTINNPRTRQITEHSFAMPGRPLTRNSRAQLAHSLILSRERCNVLRAERDQAQAKLDAMLSQHPKSDTRSAAK